MSNAENCVMTPEQQEGHLKAKRYELYAWLESLGIQCPKGSPTRRKAFDFLDGYATMKNEELKKQIGFLQKTAEDKRRAKQGK